MSVSTITASASSQEWFLQPIQWCGRTWQWMKTIEEGSYLYKTGQIALRIFSAIPFVFATLVSIILMDCFVRDDSTGFASRDVTQVLSPQNEATTLVPALVHKGLTEKEIEQLILNRLSIFIPLISARAVSVQKSANSSSETSVSRTVTVDMSVSIKSSTTFCQLLEDNFHNLPPVHLNNLYQCLVSNSPEGLQKELVRALQLHPKIEFYFPFDLAYVRTSLV